MLYRENMIFKLNSDKYRIVGSNDKKEDIFIINMKEGSHWNTIISRVKLEDCFIKGLAKEVTDDKYEVKYDF